MTSRRLASLALGPLSVAAALLASAPARAHFILEEPASWNSQDSLGSPQKLGPCGNEGGTPTGIVTPFVAGQTISITIDETIYHPGHYRVALALHDQSELPEPPPVTPGSTACGSTVIEATPTFPILADGVLLHDQPFDGPQTFQVTLPPGVTCEHCTLQILEFMGQHGLNNPGGCFYHHCADISISGAGGEGGAGQGGAAGQAGMSAGGASAGGASAGGMSAGGAGQGGASAGGSSAGQSGAGQAGTGGASAGGSSAGGASAGSSAGGASASGAAGASGGKATGGAGAVAGASAGGADAGADADDSSDGGCAAGAGPAPGALGALLLGAAGWLARRRRATR